MRLLLLLSVWVATVVAKPGWATFYGLPGGAQKGSDDSGMNPNNGACGVGALQGLEAQYFAAISDASPAFDMSCETSAEGGVPHCTGNTCGECFAVQCVAKLHKDDPFAIKEDGHDGDPGCVAAPGSPQVRVVVVRITDACPAEHPNNKKKGDRNKCSKHYNTMDLAWDAFSAIAFPHVGSVNVEFNRVDCDRVNLGPYEARSTLMQEGRLGAALETASHKAGGGKGKFKQENKSAQSVEARYTGRRLRRLMHDDGTTNADESASVNTSEDGDEAEDARYLSEEVSMAQCEGDHTSTKSVLTRALLQAALVGRNATVH